MLNEASPLLIARFGTNTLTRLSFFADEGQGKAASKGGSTEVVLGDLGLVLF
jgi:hypothetical protein